MRTSSKVYVFSDGLRSLWKGFGNVRQTARAPSRTPPSTGGRRSSLRGASAPRLTRCCARSSRRAREQRRETAEPSRDGGSSRLFSPRRRVGTRRGLVAVATVVGQPGGRTRRARAAHSMRVLAGDTRGYMPRGERRVSSRGGDRRHEAAAGRGAHPVFTSVTGCERDKVIRAPRREVKAGWCATGVESVCALSPEATGGMVGPANGLRQQQRAAATVAGG